MDQEAQLIRAENWNELRRLYAKQTGHSWEEAWVSLLKLKDRQSAVESFKKSLRDPHFEEAATIMLWRLGDRPSKRRTALPISLRLYEAYQDGDFRPFLSYFLSPEGDWAYAAQVFERVLHSKKAIQEDDLHLLPQNNLSPGAAYFLGQIYNLRMRDVDQAGRLFERFVSDLWVQRVLNESRRELLDREMSRRLRHAYAHKDGNTLKRLLKALQAKNKKLKIASIWKKAFEVGLRVELEKLTENLLGYPFWKQMEWSPTALYQMRLEAFPEERVVPDFVERWDSFFQSEHLKTLPPLDLEPDRLSLWQITVELNHAKLSEALLKFPTEERFLFLWSLRHQDQKKRDPSAWPSHEQESEVVRKNLQRAFERSSNKLLWFDRLRSCGCSQSFYEFALSQIEIPIPWILEDLESQRLAPRPKVRAYLKEKLMVTAPNSTESHSLEPQQVLGCMHYLTPAETQEVLLSRYVLLDIPQEILSDEVLDVFWEARTRVGPDIAQRWLDSALTFVVTKDRSLWRGREWRWVLAVWQVDPQSLERFSPRVQDRESFPWGAYLEAAAEHQLFRLILTCLPQIPDERIQADWIAFLIRQAPDQRLQKFISAVRDESLRADLEVQWQESQGEVESLYEALKLKLETTAVLNEKPKVLHRLLSCFSKLPESIQLEKFSDLQLWLEELQALGACDANFLRKLVEVADQLGDWGHSWKWSLQEWYFSKQEQREELLDRFLDSAFRARSIEEAQRILVEDLFGASKPTVYSQKILDRLLRQDSVFRIKHLRRELIVKASRIFPVHDNILRYRASFDYRAVLLWNAFYGEDLEEMASRPEWKKRKTCQFWGLIQAQTQPEAVRAFTRYLNILPSRLESSEKHELLSRAQKILAQTAKSFRMKKKIQLHLNSRIGSPLIFHLENPALEIHPLFFQELDENLWAAVVCGFLQMLTDRSKGLFEEAALVERFFQGLLLAGAPIEKVIRLCTWLALHERLVKKEILEAEPQHLVSELPFLNQLLIFYLSEDFERKSFEDGIPLC